jgi:hypothetical protein
MRHAAVVAVLALFSAWALTSSGCWGQSKAPEPARPAAAPEPPARTESLPGAAGEMQNIAVNWRELRKEMAKEQLAHKLIAAKAWAISGSSDQIMKVAERATGSPALPPKGASAEEVNKLAFTVGMGDDKVPEVLRDVELIGINAKNLGVAANGIDSPEVRKWWGQLDRLCESVCGGMVAPAPAPSTPPPAAGDKR